MFVQSQFRSCSLFTIAVLAGCGSAGAADQSTVAAVRGAIYRIQREGTGYVAANPTQGFTVHFQAGRTDFIRPDGRFSLALTGEPAPSRVSVNNNRIDASHGGVTEWFINDARGVEQGFTVAAKRGSGPLELTLQATGDFVPFLENGDVVLRRDGHAVLRYAGLRSWDADGRELPSHAAVEGDRIRLVVDDSSARYPVTVDPIVTEAILTAADGVAGDGFGNTIGVSGDTAIVGAPSHSGKGAAYVMTRSGSTWTPQATLTAADGVDGDGFGNAVAIDGDTAIVAAFFTQSGVGSAYIFTRSAGVWTQQAKLTEPGASASFLNLFGWSVAIAGDTVLIGSPLSPNLISAGAAYVFTRSGTTWSLQSKLTAPGTKGFQNVGQAVALSGDTAVVGAAVEINSSSTAGFVFVRSGTLWSAQATLIGSDQNTASGAGLAVAVSGDTVLIGAPGCVGSSCTGAHGAVYVFVRSGVVWSQQAKLTPSDTAAQDRFGIALALSGDVAIVGAKGKLANAGAAYLFSRAGAAWSEFKLTPASPPAGGDLYGTSAAMSADTFLIGSPNANAGKGQVYALRYTNVSLSSTPSGRTFTLSGTGCGNTGTFTAPYTGLWSNCTVQWTSPDATAVDTRYSLQNWSDGGALNPRTFTPPSDPMLPPSSFTGNFGIEYLLTTQSIPTSGGTVNGAGWYAAGTTTGIFAAPNSGFVLTSFSGALTGSSNPQGLLMNGPKSVTGNFTTTPPATLTATIVTKSGGASSRFWAIVLNNTGPGTAYNAQVYVLSFVQTFGAPCSSPPVRLSPAILPVSMGNINAGSGALTQFTLDFSACPVNARFTVNLGYASNGGASGGLIQLVNQVQ